MPPPVVHPPEMPQPGMMLAPLTGLPEIRAGDDLVALIAAAAGDLTWPDGTAGVAPADILVVTSKVVAKAEGRSRPAMDRDAAISEEAVADVAMVPGAPGQPDTRVVRTRHGLVLASAGIDASNVAEGTVLLLPEDPDASARHLRRGLAAALGVPLGIVISDTAGRPWRMGQVDLAIGVAGVAPLVDLRGTRDQNGRPLVATVRAVADEIASAAELVAGKDRWVPVVAVRGLAEQVLGVSDGADAPEGPAPELVGRARRDQSGAALDGPGLEHPALDGPGAVALVRPVEQDAFRLGTTEAVALGRRARLDDLLAGRRTIRHFGERPVPAEAIRSAAAAAATAPAPHHTEPWLFVHLADRDRRAALLASMARQWAADLRADGLDEAAVERRLARGDVLRAAPEVVAVFMRTDRAHSYPDPRRQRAEREMFVAAGGAALAQFLLSLSVDGLGAAWVSSSIFCPDLVVAELDLSRDLLALGMVAIGWPGGPASAARQPRPAPLSTL